LLIRRLLQLDGSETRDPIRSPDDHFRDLRTRIEAIGVYVLLIGNLGSHHSAISEKVFRGFAIADDFAPFIIINDQDAVAARVFTLMHEFAHILIGSTGISSSPSTGQATTPKARVERYCNDVAGEFLVPAANLPRIDSQASMQEIQAEITRIAEFHNVSEPMVAYRFARTNQIDGDIYSRLIAIYAARVKAKRQQEKQKSAESENGPNYYVVRRHRIGQGLLSLVSQTLRANELTYTKAAKMLGVKPSSVEPLIQDTHPMQRRRVGEVV